MVDSIQSSLPSQLPSDVEIQSHEHRERNVRVKKFREKNKTVHRVQSDFSLTNPQTYIKPYDDSLYIVQADMGVSDQMSLDENNDKDIVEQKVTTFDDTIVKHEATDNNDQYVLNNTMPFPDLDNFLKRPILVQSVNWTAADPFKSALGIWRFPDVLFTPTYISKLEKIAFWRPNIEISIRMNGTPMHYGKLVFWWIPQQDPLNLTYTNAYASAFGNKWIQVSASANQTTVITIPFTHYKEFIQVGKQNEDLFTLNCRVSVPLSSVNGAPPSINFTVYARVVEPNLIGFNYASDFAVQSDFVTQAGERQRTKQTTSNTEAETKSKSGSVISSSVVNLGDAVSRFSWLPVIGGLADPVSAGIKAVGNVFKWFGLNIPVNVESTHPMQIRQPRLLQVDDNPTTLVLGPNASCTVAKDYALVNDSLDAASLLKFMQRPGLLYTGVIDTTRAAGDNLAAFWVNPVTMLNFDYVLPLDLSAFVPTPIAYMSKLFALWRGGMRIHLSFICSHFHSLRVKIWYIPYVKTVTSTIPSPTETQTSDLINVVLDITEETDYSFTIPYCQQSEWLETGTSTVPQSYLNTNGAWGIQIINPLTSGAATVSNMYYQVFVSAAEDFQVANPYAANIPTMGTILPQSDFDIQSAFELEECEIPSSSMQCLLEKNYPPLGNVARGRTNHSTYQALEITGIKQLTNLLTPYNNTIITDSVSAGLLISPLGDISNYNATNASAFNYMINVSAVFRYFRGGLRTYFRSDCPQAFAYADTQYGVQTTATLAIANSSANQNVVTYANGGSLTNGNAYFSPLNINPCDVVLPWYHKYKCALVNWASSGLDPRYGLRANFRFGSYTVPTTPATIYTMMSLSGADDYILGWQLGPPICTNVAPP